MLQICLEQNINTEMKINITFKYSGVYDLLRNKRHGIYSPKTYVKLFQTLITK